MLNKMIRIVMGIIGALIGLGVTIVLRDTGIIDFLFENEMNMYIIYSIVGLLSGIILYISSPRILNLLKSKINELQSLPASDLILGSVGLVVGLLIAHLISGLLFEIDVPYISQALSILVYLLFGYLGIAVPTKKREDFTNFFYIGKKSTKDKLSNLPTVIKPKILDTSVIIDGRIADICETGFIEGPLVIPEFVLEELRHIADSSDSLKRNRGRRGLDILNRIQKEIDIEVMIYEKDFEDISEVDTKLLKLGEKLNGKVVTNDYNLNKVAEFQGVEVLNINELANAVKPIVLPGEEMIVQVVKDGKESGQGVAYLDDGTMIVVDNGKKHIGETLGVMVTSVLQTAAGRMIFAKPKYMVDNTV